MPNCSELYEKLSASLQYSNMDGMCFSVKSIACSVSLQTGNLHLMDLIVFALFVVHSQSRCAQLNYFFRVIANLFPSFYPSFPLFLFPCKFEEGHPAFLQPVSSRSNEAPSPSFTTVWKPELALLPSVLCEHFTLKHSKKKTCWQIDCIHLHIWHL